jgi:hypothetical protein
MPPDRLDDTLDQTLTRRLKEIIAGDTSTEAELRLLGERGDALERSLAASVSSSERRLAALAGDTAAEVAELAAELRRVDRLRVELKHVRETLAALDLRAHVLRGEWVRRS